MDFRLDKRYYEYFESLIRSRFPEYDFHRHQVNAKLDDEGIFFFISEKHSDIGTVCKFYIKYKNL